MLKITKIVNFEAAHRLFGYDGPCAFIHGHSYKIEVELSRPSVNPDGMVWDFGKLKKAIMTFVTENWDHATLLNANDKLLANVLEGDAVSGPFAKIYLMKNGNPTVENMARELCEYLREALSGKCPAVVTCVRVWETATSFAEVKFNL